MQINIDLYGGLFVQSSTVRWQFGYGRSATPIDTIENAISKIAANLSYLSIQISAALILNHGRNCIVSAIKWFFENAKLSQHRAELIKIRYEFVHGKKKTFQGLEANELSTDNSTRNS